MRERSHKLGEVYQKSVKHWLSQTTFLKFSTEQFGDTYDASKTACTVGEIVFDFSLKLNKDKETEQILHAECKYRDERKNRSDPGFNDFVKNVCQALTKADNDQHKTCHFLFVSNVPPNDWRNFLRNKLAYIKQILKTTKPTIKDEILECAAQRVHILALSKEIIDRR